MRNIAAKLSQKTFIKIMPGDTKRRYVVQNKCPVASDNRITSTAKNIVISPDFLVWKFRRETQFPHSFGQIAQNFAETVPLGKISTPGNQMKL